MELKAEGAVPIHGLNYKDKPADAAEWLGTLGDPYTRTGADRDGRVALAWGDYGVPKTVVVSASGRIDRKHTVTLTPPIRCEPLQPPCNRTPPGGSEQAQL